MKKGFIFISAALLLLTSCIEGSQGVFFTLESEEIVNDVTNLPNNLSVTGLAILGTELYLTSLEARRKSVSAADWSMWRPSSIDSSISNNQAHPIILDTIANGTNVYALVKNGSVNQVYTSVDGTTWTLVTLPGGAIPTNFGEVRDNTGSVTHILINYRPDSSSGYLVLYGNAGTFNPLDITAAPADGYSSPFFQGSVNGTDVFLINRSTLLSSNANIAGTFTTIDKDDKFTSSVSNFGGVNHSDLGWIISADNGHLYQAANFADNFSRINSTAILSGESPVKFGTITPWESGGDTILLVASNNGYYEVYMDGADLTVDVPSNSTDENSYISKALSSANIHRIRTGRDSTDLSVNDEIIFFGTTSQGLWKREANGSLDVQ